MHVFLLSIDPGTRFQDPEAVFLDDVPKVAILSSGYSGDPVMSNYEVYGFRGVILKPWTIKILVSVLHDVLTTDRK